MRWTHLAALMAAATALVATGAVLLFQGKSSGRQADIPKAVAPKAPEEIPRFQDEECPPALVRTAASRANLRHVVCGKFFVPQTAGSKKSLAVGVVRLLPKTPSKRPPVLVLAGGPGDSFTPKLQSRLSYLLPFARDRQLLIIDQRGTGAGTPLLECESKLRKKDDLQRCFRDFHAELDVAAFNTQESARDIQKVLAHFQIPQVSIVAVSYGTRLALTFAEAHPDKVEALVLDSPMPASIDLFSEVAKNAQRGLGTILDACAASTECRTKFPHKLEEVSDLVLAQNQKKIPGQPSGDEFLEGLVQLSVSPGVVPLVPLLLAQAKEGNFDLFSRLRHGFSSYEFSFGLHLSVQCAEQFPKTSLAALERGAEEVLPAFRKALSASPYSEFCAVWKVPARVGPVVEETSISVPTLVLSGPFDPITPPRFADLVASSIPGARVVKIPQSSHGAAFTSCGVLVVQQHLDVFGEAAPPPLPSCASSPNDPAFALTSPSDAEVLEVLHQIQYRL